MWYQRELRFLCDVFQKGRVSIRLVRRQEAEAAPKQAKKGDPTDPLEFLREIFATLEPNTVYRLTDSFSCHTRFLLLPDTAEPTVLAVGPYLSAPMSAQRLLEVGERNGISPQQQHGLSRFYSGLSVLSDDCPLWIMFHTFCETIWNSPSFAMQDMSSHTLLAEIPFSKSMRDLSPRDTLANMRAMEQRYDFENQMIRAVELGQVHMEPQLFAAFSSNFFEKRAADPIRNAKNYGIIMNTLLRKAAERGGVHPIHLDQISSEFAAKIEQMSSLSENSALMGEMFRSYCRLVRKHALQKFSPVVKKTILIVDADLSANLAPGELAASQGISLGYLSAVFKRETGKTLSAYIRERRMNYAAYLLGSTNLQIQTVALHCGIMDVQYFSKLFRRQMGQSPTEYRQSLRGTVQS